MPQALQNCGGTLNKVRWYSGSRLPTSLGLRTLNLGASFFLGFWAFLALFLSFWIAQPQQKKTEVCQMGPPIILGGDASSDCKLPSWATVASSNPPLAWEDTEAHGKNDHWVRVFFELQRGKAQKKVGLGEAPLIGDFLLARRNLKDIFFEKYPKVPTSRWWWVPPNTGMMAES